MVRWLAALLLASLLAGCADPGKPSPLAAADSATPAPRPPIVLSGSFTASGCLLPASFVAVGRGQVGDVQPVASDAWERTYTTSSNATAAATQGPLCVTWLDQAGNYVWSPTLGVVPDNAARVIVQADGQAVVSYRITIH